MRDLLLPLLDCVEQLLTKFTAQVTSGVEKDALGQHFIKLVCTLGSPQKPVTNTKNITQGPYLDMLSQ